MSRRLHNAMAQARASLNNRDRSQSDWYLEEKARQAAAGPVTVDVPAPPERTYHQAIKTPEHRCYRVIRFWKGEDFPEDIGYFKTETEAFRLMNRELGWAIVVNPNHKRIAFNYQPMTSRPV